MRQIEKVGLLAQRRFRDRLCSARKVVSPITAALIDAFTPTLPASVSVETRQEEGQQCETHTSGANQYDASRIAETCSQQHHEDVK